MPTYTVVDFCMVFYNIGILNAMINSNKGTWCKRYHLLKKDLRKIFHSEKSVQAVFVSEFGNMENTIDDDLQRLVDETLQGSNLNLDQNPHIRSSTQAVFEQLVRDIDQPNIKVIAHPPYVALIVTDEWSVLHDSTLGSSVLLWKHIPSSSSCKSCICFTNKVEQRLWFATVTCPLRSRKVHNGNKMR